MQSPSLFVGIDIGAERLHVCVLAPGQHARTAPILIVELSDPLWPSKLEPLFAPSTRVAFEPTGWHYSAAIVRLAQHCGAELIQVEHRTTPKIRALFISEVKTDTTDARTLALAAQSFPQFNGMHRVQPDIMQDSVTALRVLVHDYARSVKESTRSMNRLHQLTRAVWPSLSVELTVYLRAAAFFYITPDQLRTLAVKLNTASTKHSWEPAFATAYRTATSHAALTALAESLPEWLHDTPLTPTINREVGVLMQHQNERARLVLEMTAAIDRPPFAQAHCLVAHRAIE